MAGVAWIDPQEVLRALVRCPSVTPADHGALAVIEEALERLGAKCHRLSFGGPGPSEVQNLYGRLGTAGRNFCFAGHTDVVPPGDRAAWSVDPFGGVIADGRLYGRGAVDMKGALACFLAALGRFCQERKAWVGSVSLLVTGDEEGVAQHGTRRVLEWLAARGEKLDVCLVGEPTSVARLGDELKHGRRGSLSARLVIHGVQGHVAHPHLADNPIHRALALLSRWTQEPLDSGTPHFAPSSLQVTSIDTGNPTSNVIPAKVEVRLNIRFNDRHSGASLERDLRARLEAASLRYELYVDPSAEPFVCPPGPLTELVAAAVGDVVGTQPRLSTGGGTSDARFIVAHCPVVELGLVNATMHKVDESVALDELELLTRIYQRVLDRYFAE